LRIGTQTTASQIKVSRMHRGSKSARPGKSRQRHHNRTLFGIDQLQPSVACVPRDMPAKGAPNVVGTPSIVGTPLWVLGHGRALGAADTDGVEKVVMPLSGISALIAGAEGLGLSATDGGLRPPPPSSVEPRGIPTGPMGEPGEANGGDAVADATQGPCALAVMPPPSNTALPDCPGVELAMPAVPIVEPAIPADVPVIGLAVVVELPMAADAGDAPAHVAASKGAAPDVVGLTPGVASSIAPKGIPVCPTGALGMPSGDVMPKAGSGETLMRAWA
jgi:hypothetical protein